MTGIKNISINPPKTSIKMDEISNALRSLKMPGMAHYWTAMQETRQHDSLSLKDGLQLLIQAELDNRILSRNARLVKNARFRYKASIGEVIYDSKRGVDKQKVLNLATCDYVRKGVSVLITGAAGTGKSWLGTALGHQACMNGYKVAYYKQSDLQMVLDNEANDLQQNLIQIQSLVNKRDNSFSVANKVISKENRTASTTIQSMGY